MSSQSARTAKAAASARRGAAFLLLVMTVLLVIVAATQWLVSSSVTNRKGEADRLRARSMIAAIDQVQGASDLQMPLRLPIDEASNERIEVVASEDDSILTAIWLRGDAEIARLVRPRDFSSDPLISQ